MERNASKTGRSKPKGANTDPLRSDHWTAFDPHSKGLKTWQLLLFCCLLYHAFLLPYAVTFIPAERAELANQRAFQLFYAVEVLFCADFYVQLNTGFYQDGAIRRNARTARMNYIKSLGFVLDVAAIVPLALMPIRLPHSTHIVWLEMHKMLRARRLPMFFSALDDVFSKHFLAMKLFRTSILTALIVHYIACGRHAFSWIVTDSAPSTWLPDESFGQDELKSKYTSSLFWSLGLITGVFEGELPSRSNEFAFTTCVTVLGFALFTYLCSVLLVLSKGESSQAAAAEARINQLNHLLAFHKVPDTLRSQVVEFIQHHNTDAESNDREVTKLLCRSISKDIQVELLKDMMSKIPLFKGCNEQFIVALTSLLELISLPAHHTLFEIGDAGDCMYVVNSGVLHILVKGKKVRELRQGSFFGEVSVFSKQLRSATVVTMSYCTLYRLSRFDTERVLEGYPHYAVLIAQAVDEIVNQRQKPAADGTEKPTEDETMLTTLYQLSTESPDRRKHKKNRSLTSQLSFRSKKHTLVRSKSSLGMPTASHTETDTESISYKEKAELNTTAIEPTKVAPKKRPQLTRSKSAFPHQLTTLVSPLTKHAKSAHTGATPQDAIQGFYDKLSNRLLQEEREGSAMKNGVLSKLLMTKAISTTSPIRQCWLVVMQVHTAFNWVFIPLVLAFPLVESSVVLHIVVYSIGDLILMADLYMNCHLPYVDENHKSVTHPTKIARRYFRTVPFLADILCLLPYEVILLWSSIPNPALLRIPRLLRAWRVFGHAREWELSFRLGGVGKFVIVTVVFLLFVHLVTCLHFGLTHIEGFSSMTTAWMPTDDLDVHKVKLSSGATVYQGPNSTIYNREQIGPILRMQYTRSLYLATAILTTRGKIAEPASNLQYEIASVIMLIGLVWTAFFVEKVQKHFATSALEQKEFLVTRARIQNFLRCQNAPLKLHHQVNAFLDFWWSSHRGAIASELLNELPETLKRQVLRSICQPALQTISLMNGVRPVQDELEQVFVDNVKIILYGQGETIYRQGDYASGLFFLLEGEVVVISNGGVPKTLSRGGFVGTAALHLNESSVSYAERLTATTGCILLFVGRAHLDAMHKTFPGLSMALKALEKRIVSTKLAKPQEISPTDLVQSSQTESLETRVLKLFGIEEVVFDPDATSTSVWEVWMLLVMSAQSFKVIYDVCFGVQHTSSSDAVLVVLEVFFCLDYFVQSRLGFYQFGNKVMKLKVIKKQYHCSRRGMIEIAAILPLFTINWILPFFSAREELLNVNKLLRLSRVPRTFANLENRYLNRIRELRIAKLVFISLFLSHILGCVWFTFGVDVASVKGSTEWLSTTRFAKEDRRSQYPAAIFWSLGLMTASYSIEPPKLTSQCMFTVLVLLCGFFLFAFIVGNFADVIELADADAREFNAKMSSLRHLLTHFQLPHPIQDKLKMYFFFQRFHTITQEHILERCLPPSLVTDIRLVHLQPMITKVAFLSGMEGSVTRMLVSQFSQVLVVKNQYVCRYGEEGSDMYFVFTGVLEVLVPSDTLRRKLSNEVPALATPTGTTRTAGPPAEAVTAAFRTFFSDADTKTPYKKPQMKKVSELTSGSYFGEVAMFTSKPRSAHTRSRTSCVLYKLSRQSLELVFERYPDWKAKVMKIVNIQQKQQHLRNMYMEEQQDALMQGNSGIAKIILLNAVQPSGTIRQLTFSDRLVSESKRLRHGFSRRGSSVSSAIGAQELTKSSSAASSTDLRFRKQASPLWVDTFLHCTEAQSAFHVFWLKVIAVATVFMALAVPYRISFDPQGRFGAFPIFLRVVELSCEVLFAWDIWLNWNMREGPASMELYEQHHRQSYRKERLLWDALATFPIDHFLSDFFWSPWFRINRCLKLVNFSHYMAEITRRSVSYERNRVFTFWVLYFVCIHWCACMYFSVARITTRGSADSQNDWNNWAAPSMFLTPPVKNMTIEWSLLRFFRSFFFAATAFTKRGKTFSPNDWFEYIFSTLVAFMGLLAMAFMIGASANLYASYISNEVEFRKNHIAINMYLERWCVSSRLKRRARAFLSSLWSAHRGVNYQTLFDEIPLKLRVEAIEFIASSPLDKFLSVVFRPFTTTYPQDRELKLLMHAISQQLKYEGYPRDEDVLTEGSVSKTMYFVVKGHLVSHSVSNLASELQIDTERLTNGNYFGEQGLLGYSVSRSTVKTVSTCDLLSLSSEDLLEVLLSRSLFKNALSIAVEAYREMCKQEHVAGMPQSAEDEWGEVISTILEKRKETWREEVLAMRENGPNEEEWKMNRAGREVGLLLARKPSECVRLFEAMLQLIVARGVMFNRIDSQQSTTSHFQDNLPLMTATSLGVLADAKLSSARTPSALAPSSDAIPTSGGTATSVD